MSLEFANRICPNCKSPNYMVFLGDFSKAYKYKCMNCNGYFNDIDFEKETPLKEIMEETMKLKKDTTLLELAHIAAENKVRIELTIDAEGNETISAEPWVPFKYTCPQANNYVQLKRQPLEGK